MYTRTYMGEYWVGCCGSLFFFAPISCWPFLLLCTLYSFSQTSRNARKNGGAQVILVLFSHILTKIKFTLLLFPCVYCIHVFGMLRGFGPSTWSTNDFIYKWRWASGLLDIKWILDIFIFCNIHLYMVVCCFPLFWREKKVQPTVMLRWQWHVDQTREKETKTYCIKCVNLFKFKSVPGILSYSPLLN